MSRFRPSFGLPPAEHEDRLPAWTLRLRSATAFLVRAKASDDMEMLHRAIGDVWFWIGRLTADLLSSRSTGQAAQDAARAIMEARTAIG